MPLPPGTRLGSYEIVSAIGAGGMGEVYRARDSRLNRDVAIKVLPQNVSSDPERSLRFAREARTLAALNHPHVAAIYELEQVDGVSALVLELVEGPTLADRIAGGALNLREALRIAQQIADALDAAHEKGIIHRDLKPANVKLTANGDVKVLDFGLAKALDVTAADGTGPTISSAGLTQAGAFMGTPAYMSPEQARGDVVDKRTDIWSFGVVLYEMLTGRRPFAGATTTDTLAAVLKDDPEWNDVPPAARRLVARCLEKDPKRRLRDIADATALIDEGHPTGTVAPARRVLRLWPATAAVGLVATLVLLLWLRRDAVPPPSALQFDVTLPAGTVGDAPILSPDGRNLAFVTGAPATGRPRLWMHSFSSGQSRQLFEATKFMASPPFWSPDSQHVGFMADGSLRRVSVADGSVHTICDLQAPVGGATWNRDGTIVFSNGGMHSVPATGGSPVRVTALSAARKEIGHYMPVFLPGGRRFLYLRVSPTTDQSGIYIGSLDARPEEQSLTRLIATRSNVLYAPSRDGDGHLLFLRDGRLMAQPFDLRALQLTGEPVQVIERVGVNGAPSNRFLYASVSETGHLAYRGSDVFMGLPVWVTRDGREGDALVTTPLPSVQNPRFSPDGNRLAIVVNGDVWVYSLGGAPPMKLTFDGNNDLPLWSPDGQRIIYAANGSPRLVSIAAAGAEQTATTVSPPGHYHPHGWSADGEHMIVVLNTYSPTSWDLLKLPVRTPAAPQPISATSYAEGLIGAALSPNGRWLAYTSTMTGTMELWIQPYPGPGSPTRISLNGGADPVWARDGRELYYLEGKKLMVVAVDDGATSTFRAKPAAVLFESRYVHPPASPLTYDVARDGRFLMIKPAETQPAAPPFSVVLNWTSRLAR